MHPSPNVAIPLNPCVPKCSVGDVKELAVLSVNKLIVLSALGRVFGAC
jgi:hypothetical protein